MNAKLLGFAALLLYCSITKAVELDIANSTVQNSKVISKPVGIAKSWTREFHVGKCRFLSDKNTLTKLNEDGRTEWKLKSDNGYYLHWMTQSGDVAYIVCYQIDDDGRFSNYEFPPRLHRVNLKTGSWLSELPLPDRGDQSRRPGAVLSVLAEKEKTVVLTSLVKASIHKNEKPVIEAYEVRCFTSEATKPAWSKTFSAVGEREYTGGLVWGIPLPQYAASAIQQLTWCGDKLLVCAEAMEPVLCLDGDTGSELWRMERAWEFQRGFIGPSVWSHFISRFAVDDDFLPEKSNIEAQRKEFGKEFRCALVAGPVVVPLTIPRNDDTHSIFLAVTKGSAKSSWTGYVSQCLVYEFNDSGKPVSMAELPQMIDGSQFSVVQGGVIWKCHNETLIKINPALRAPVVQMGGGGADGISHVMWLHRMSYAEPAAWLVAPKICNSTPFGETYAFCLPAGGYILRENDSVYRFPIAAFNLSTGVETALTLNVPFKEKISPPESNYSSTTLPDGTQSFRTMNPVEVAITELQLNGNELEIVLGLEKTATSVKFNVNDMITPQSVPSKNHADLEK